MQTINFDFCSLGMQAPDNMKNMKPVKKRTKVMTNSGHIAAALAKCQCSRDHEHVHLEGGKASACEVYPRFFCELMVKGLKREIGDRKWLSKVHDTIMDEKMMGELMKLVENAEALEVPPDDERAQLDEHRKLDAEGYFCDDISGVTLDKELVIEARLTEMNFFKRMGVYTRSRRRRA